METFKIAFVQKKGNVLYYGYKGFAYLTKDIDEGYNFEKSFYNTKEHRIEEANRLAKFFFGIGEVTPIIIE